MRVSMKSFMGMTLMKRMNMSRLIIIGDMVVGIKELGIEKIGLLSLEGMQGEVLERLRLENIIV